MSPAELRLVREPAPPSPMDSLDRRSRIFLWVSMIFGIAAAGVAFVYKLAEFLFTLGSNDVQGFADVPVTIYFVVAAGWLSLLGWSYVSGQFRNMEDAKYDFLAKEKEYERRGE